MTSDDALLRTVAIVIAAVLLVPFVLMLFAMPLLGGMGAGHMWNDGGWHGSDAGWAWVAMWFVMLAVIGLIGYALARALRGSTADARDPAMQELRTAYARGDLTDEEFERRRERLQRSAENGDA